MARWYIGGLLHHAPSLLAFTNPTVNSYRRLVPGFEAPVNLVYSQRNRSACTRIPVTGTNAEGQADRVPRAGPVVQPVPGVLGDADGRPRRHHRTRSSRRRRSTRTCYDLPPEEFASVTQVPGSLTEVLDALEADHDYLLEGGVFTPDLIETWIDVQANRTRSTRCACARPRTSSRCTTTSAQRRPHTCVNTAYGRRESADSPHESDRDRLNSGPGRFVLVEELAQSG